MGSCSPPRLLSPGGDGGVRLITPSGTSSSLEAGAHQSLCIYCLYVYVISSFLKSDEVGITVESSLNVIDRFLETATLSETT